MWFGPTAELFVDGGNWELNWKNLAGFNQRKYDTINAELEMYTETITICYSISKVQSEKEGDLTQSYNKLEPQGALIAHLSTKSTSVIS